MQSTEERVSAIKERVKELEAKKHRRNRVIAMSSVVACLAVVFVVAFNMPNLMEGLPGDDFIYSGNAASIFSNETSIGYVFIGILAFILGCGATILSYRLSRKRAEHPGDRTDG